MEEGPRPALTGQCELGIVHVDGDDRRALARRPGQHDRLLELRRLDLAGCRISDDSVRQLSVFRRLAHLDLSNTPITWEALHLIHWLPELESLNIEGTAVKWWTRRMLRAQMWRKRQLAAAARAMHPTQLR